MSSRSGSLLIGIEISHAAEGDLSGQISADVFATHCRGGGGTRAQIDVNGTDLVFIVTGGGWGRPTEGLLHRRGRGAVRKIVRKLEVFDSVSDRLRRVEVYLAHERGMPGIGGA